MDTIKDLLTPFSTEKITALTAFVAVLVGPVISILLAKWQIRASVVSSNRQNWINDLRERISEFVTIANTLIEAKILKTKDEKTLSLEMDKISRLQTTIVLMLNPDEELHNKLQKRTTNVMTILYSYDSENAVNNVRSDTSLIIELTKPILKSEWVRVKRGK